MGAPTKLFQSNATSHATITGPSDARPTALQVVKDCDMTGEPKRQDARALYETGAKLYITARNIPKLEKVIDDIMSKAQYTGSRPVPVELHLDSLESVRQGAAEFKAKSKGELNILINNAGVMTCPYSKTVDGFETQIGTNHFAGFLLFQLLEPLLLKSAQSTRSMSRIINLSSTGHRFCGVNFDDINFQAPGSYEKWRAYGQSKTASVYMAASISRHYAAQGLTDLAVHPGGTATDLGRHLSAEDWEAFPNLEEMMKECKSPEQGAATTVWAAISPHFEKFENGGRYLSDVDEAAAVTVDAPAIMPGYSAHFYNEEAEERL